MMMMAARCRRHSSSSHSVLLQPLVVAVIMCSATMMMMSSLCVMRSSSFAGMIQLADATPLSPFAATACALRHASIPAALFNDLGCYCGSALNVAKRGLPIDETDHCCYVYDTCVQDSSEANCNSPDEAFDALCVDGDDTVVCLDETSKCCKCVRILAQCIRQAVEFHDGSFARSSFLIIYYPLKNHTNSLAHSSSTTII